MTGNEDREHDAGELVLQAMDGDPDAVEALYRLYEHRMIGIVHRKLGNTLHGLMESVDLVQSAWKDALDHLDDFEYQGPDSFFLWLRSCLMNKIHSKRRYFTAAKRDPKKELPIQRDEILSAGIPHGDSDPTPSQIVMREEETDRLMRILERFPELQRRVLILRMRDELSYEEIGRRIGKSAEAAGKIYNRSLKRLLEQLPEDWRTAQG